MISTFCPNPNSFKNTFCVFKEVDLVSIQGLIISFESKSGSLYYFTELGMYRLSNHWGRLANSKWRLEPMELNTTSKTKLGFATWDSFYPDNTTENLYYLEMDYAKNTVNYQHLKNPDYNQKAVLRNSLETTKRIKQIRNILERTSWAKYFECDDISLLRHLLIEELIFTNKSLEEIKRNLTEKLSN